MGVSVWFFQRMRPGELCPLTQSALDAFMFKGGRLARDAEGFVAYAQVVVSLSNRCAQDVLRVGFFRYRALDDGRLDRNYYDEIKRTIPVAAFGWLRLDKSPPGLVGAEDKFAKRRLEHLNQWKPTKAELALLRELVNRRAGREIL